MAGKKRKKGRKGSKSRAPRSAEERRASEARRRKGERARRRAADRRLFERDEFPGIGWRDRLVTLLALAVISAAWIASVPALFSQAGMGQAIQLASFYFACFLWLYVTRCAVESRRRYGVVTLRSMWYYSQTTIYSARRSATIFVVLFAVLMVLRWLLPSPNLGVRAISCMDMAGAYYLSYIHSTYYGKEQVPYRYMETAFVVLTSVSPYLVYLMQQ